MISDRAFIYTCVILVVRPFLWHHGQGHLSVSNTKFTFKKNQSVFGPNTVTQTHLNVPIAPNYKGVCLQNTSKPHSYHLKIW